MNLDFVLNSYNESQKNLKNDPLVINISYNLLIQFNIPYTIDKKEKRDVILNYNITF